MTDRRPGFALHGNDVLAPDALRLPAELGYLPWSSGPTVEARLADGRALLAAPPDPADGRLARLRAFAADVARLFDRLTELADRDLLYAWPLGPDGVVVPPGSWRVAPGDAATPPGPRYA